jgi:hypothetical protein
MATELIELEDGLLVEVQAAPEDRPRQIAAGSAERVAGAMASARDLLLKAVEPVASVWDELNRDLAIEQVEIELALGFEAKGRLFIVQGTGSANISFKLTVKPMPAE